MTENHLLLPAIPFVAVLTSNFDKLIENAYAQRGQIPRVYTQQDVAALANLHRDRGFYVLKVHGDVDRIETVVLGHGDYRQMLFGNDAFRNYLNALWQTKILLFIGFSLDDPDVTLRFDELVQAVRNYGGKHYALMSSDSADAVRRERLERDYHIQIIPYRKSKGHPEVAEFLKALRDQSDGMSIQRPLTRQEQAQYQQALQNYRAYLIAANEYLDFRGIMQMREILRLRLEDLYVPLWAATEAVQRSLSRERAEPFTSASSPTLQQSEHTPLSQRIDKVDGGEGDDALLRALTHAEHWNRARSLYRPIDLYLGTRHLDERYIVGILAPIAFWLFETRPTGLLHRTELERRIAERLSLHGGVKETDAPSLAQEFVELIREQSGLLIERGADLFDFIHPTFKEYLAARYLAERREPLKLLGNRLFEPRWREVVLLTAGILKGDYLDDFLRSILESAGEYDDLFHRPLILAAYCLADDVSASLLLRRRILDELYSLWHELPFSPLSNTIDDLFIQAKGSCLAAEMADRLLVLLRNKDSSMCQRASEALWRLGESNEQVVDGLLALAQDNNVDAWVRYTAAQALVLVCGAKPRIFIYSGILGAQSELLVRREPNVT